MSWTDYTRAKHFGNGIYLPDSEFIADINLNLDNFFAEHPELANSVSFLPERDIILIKGNQVSILVISSIKYRHLPLFETEKLQNCFNIDESYFINKFPSSSSDMVVINDNSLSKQFEKLYSIINPVLFIFPSLYIFEKNNRKEVAKRTALDIARYLFNLEVERNKEVNEVLSRTEIFLSHKSADKSLVREVASTLLAIGYKPWLDEDKMKAGANLERSIRSGFEKSCAAVFFITPNFKDEGYLASEIDYAIAEKRDKGDRFSIITLLIPDDKDRYGEVPKLLRSYVWKEVLPIEILRTIIEALPVKLENLEWVNDSE